VTINSTVRRGKLTLLLLLLPGSGMVPTKSIKPSTDL
jgi:hypothetical protein